MASFKFYKDLGLTEVFDPLVDRIGPVTESSQDFVLYLGSTDSGKKIEESLSPGTGNIVASITDTDVGNNLEASDVKLASSNPNLDSAVAGNPLTIGTSVLSGVGNKVEIHIRVEYSGGITSDETVGIALNTVVESAV